MAYGVLGVGAIGAAIVTGLCENVDEAPEVLLSPRNAGIAAGLARRFASVEVAAGNQAVVDGARGRGRVPPSTGRAERARRSPLSRRPGRHQRDGRGAGQGPPAAGGAGHGCGARDPAPGGGAARRHHAGPSAQRRGRALFDRLGETVELADGKAFEAFSASSATIAAHFRYLDTIASWLESQAIAEPAATRYVASMFAGLAAATRSGAALRATGARTRHLRRDQRAVSRTGSSRAGPSSTSASACNASSTG